MQHLTFEDITQSAIEAILRQGKPLFKKQITACIKNSQHLSASLFWDYYVNKNGVPKENEKGFLQGPDAYRYYYFENLHTTENICLHKNYDKSYSAYIEDAERRTNNGETQTQCTKCGKWFFKHEI
jgi:hypothetical protein